MASRNQRSRPDRLVSRPESPGAAELAGDAIDGLRQDTYEQRRAALLADEQAADRARSTLRTGTRIPLEPDPAIRPHLGPGETVIAVHRTVTVEPAVRSAADPPHGVLYVTSRRLMYLGARLFARNLDEIREVGVARDRVFILMKDGGCLELMVVRPRLLRAEVGAARAAVRARRAGTTAASPGEVVSPPVQDMDR